MEVMMEVTSPIIYDCINCDIGSKIDLPVDNKVIVELHSIERISEAHHKQVITYLRLSGKKLGILVNFDTQNITENIFRKVNHL